MLEEREARMTLEAKLNKIINMKEIDQNFALIQDNDFFEGVKKRQKENREKQHQKYDQKTLAFQEMMISKD